VNTLIVYYVYDMYAFVHMLIIINETPSSLSLFESVHRFKAC